MEDNNKTRLMQFIKHLGMSTRAFETRCGLSNGYIRSMRKGLGTDKLNNVLQEFPELSRDWLLFGEGEMLSSTQGTDTPAIQEPETPQGNIRYWEDVSATGGSLEFLENPDEHKIRWINVPNFSECTDAVNFWGDSMHPLYQSGEVIILKEWTENFIDYGNVYLVITRNGNRMVKYLRKSADETTVMCVSENKAFDSFEIDKADILKLYLVKGSIKKNAT